MYIHETYIHIYTYMKYNIQNNVQKNVIYMEKHIFKKVDKK